MSQRGRESDPRRGRAPGAMLPPALAALLGSGEGQRVEFKRELPAEQRLVRVLAGLANGGGATLLVGVDDRGRVVGVDDPGQAERDVRRAAGLHLTPVPSLRATVYAIEGKNVLSLEVGPPLGGGVVRELLRPDRQAVIRVNDHTHPVSRLPEGAELSRAKRLSLVPPRVRERYLRMVRACSSSNLQVFRVAEYAQVCNVSARTTRRDLVLLSRVFLLVEVEKGQYEIIRD